ncbi:hypothetical protein JTE90_003213 [Oedothorax gibbosus]|uniref:Ciliary microtubule inner protein 2A-C-like domain-containing protein n=1 Tax=Oedothorax gibbosus TaxID=931172 RepID=A0AAV6TU83_9ARAC|nr:hypothetical protein JTE90_003213 [Oedothorax gibbosus]
MSKYSSLNISYDRPAPEPHFIPGYTGHCPELENQIGIAYPIATYLILRNRPDVASILSDMRPSRSTYGSQKSQSSKDRHKSRNHMTETGKDGYKSSCHDRDSHRCSSKDISKGKKDRKQWNTEGSQKRNVKNNGCGRKQKHLEVDISFGNNMKPNSYECGAKSHRHLYLEGDMGCGQNQEIGDNFDGSEGHKHSSSGGT